MKLLNILILAVCFYNFTQPMEKKLDKKIVAELKHIYGEGTFTISREDIIPRFRQESSFQLKVKTDVLEDEVRYSELQLILQKIIDLLSHELGDLLTRNYNIIELFPKEGPTLTATIKNFISPDLNARITQEPFFTQYELIAEKEIAQLNSFNIKLEEIIMNYTQQLSNLIFHDILLPHDENEPAIVIELKLFVKKST